MRAKRELFALAVLPFLVAAIIWAPPWVFLAILGVVAILAGDELLSMARISGIPCERFHPLVALTAIMGAGWRWGLGGLALATAVSILGLVTVQLAHPERPAGALSASAVGVFTAVYIGYTAVSLGWIRTLPGDALGIRLLLFFLATIWAGDSGAYYVGKNLGSHRMSPRISPNKTWEGLAGGVAATYAGAALLKVILGLDLDWVHVFGLATILAVAAPVGDLVESQFKRDTGVKDSSGMLPGHGGFLDRTDSLFFAAPPFLAYLVLTTQLR